LKHVFLTITTAIRANVTNKKVYWVPLANFKTCKNLKEYLHKEDAELKIKEMTVLFDKVAIANSKDLKKMLQPGSMVDITLEISDGRTQEYVVHDK